MNLKTFSPAGFASALAVFSATAVVSATAPAHAFAPVTFGYDCAASSACTTGQNQFKTTVSQQGLPANQVLFTFINHLLPGGSQASSITGISFIDTPMLSLKKILGVTNTSGVLFNSGTATSSKGTNTFTFSNQGGVSNGINPGEKLSILFQIRDGFSSPIDAVIADLQKDKNGGASSLGILLTARGFSGQQTSFKADFHNSAVPEPLTMLGSGAALGVGALLKKKGSKSKKQKAQVS